MSLPDYNNVYGSFDSGANLEKIASYIRHEYSNSLLEIKVYKSHDGSKIISIKDSSMELSSRKLKNGNYSFAGAVGGDLESVLLALNELCTIFKRHGLSLVNLCGHPFLELLKRLWWVSLHCSGRVFNSPV